MQEAVLARQNTCICGPVEIDLFIVATAATWIYFHKGRQEENHTDAYGFSMGDAGQLGILLLFEYHVKNLIPLFTAARERHVTEPRDKVFGMIGLMPRAIVQGQHEDLDLLKPDYNKSLADVLRDATRVAFLGADGIKMLGAWDHRSDGDLELDGSCSWAVPLHLRNNREEDTAGAQHTFNCGGKADDSTFHSLQHDVIEDLAILRLTGFQLDEVMWRSERLPRSGGVSILLPILAGSDTPENLAMTMTCGQFRSAYAGRDELLRAFEAYRAFVLAKEAHPPLADKVRPGDDPATLAASRFWTLAWRFCCNRRIFRTKLGVLGLGPRAMREGDIVAVLYGGPWPYVLRPLGETGEYQFVGRAYIDNIMDGEAAERHLQEARPDVVFRLR